MKILIVDDFYHTQKKNSFGGGTAKVSRSQAIILSRNSWDVVFLTEAGSEELNGEGFKHIKSKVARCNSGRSMSIEDCELMMQEIKELTVSFNFDVILMHTMIAKHLFLNIHNYVDVPRIYMLHGNRANGILGTDQSDSIYYDCFNVFQENGGLVGSVSEAAIEWWNNIVDLGYTKTKNKFIKQLISPNSFVDEELSQFPLRKAEDYVTIVSRDSPDKNVVEALDLLEKANIKAKVFLAKQNWTPIEYSNLINKPRKSIEIFYNSHQGFIYDIVSKSRLNINFSANECGGLVPIEAALMGIPTLVVYDSDVDHGNLSVLKQIKVEGFGINKKFLTLNEVEKNFSDVLEIVFKEEFETRKERFNMAHENVASKVWFREFNRLIKEYTHA